MIPLLLIVIAAVSYFAGTLSGAELLARHLARGRFRRARHHGTVSYSMLSRRFGIKWALAAGAVDAAKFALIALLAGLLMNIPGDGFPVIGRLFSGFCMALGDMYPFQRGFRGGRGVLCLITTLWVAQWQAGLFATAVFVAVLALTQYVSLSSLTSCLSGAIGAWVFVDAAQQKGLAGLIVIFTCAAVAWRHRGSIAKLAAHQEQRMIWGRAPEDKLRDDRFGRR